MKKKFFLGFIIILNVVLIIGQIIISQRMASFNSDLKQMQNETQNLELDNELLKSEIATSSSLMTVAKKAEEYGLKRMNVIYIENPQVALNK